MVNPRPPRFPNFSRQSVRLYVVGAKRDSIILIGNLFTARRCLQLGARNRPPVAFAFDIVSFLGIGLQQVPNLSSSKDGVLLRGHTPIPAAHEAMKILNGANELGV